MNKLCFHLNHQSLIIHFNLPVQWQLLYQSLRQNPWIQVSVGTGRTDSRPLFGRDLKFFYQSTLCHLLLKGEAQQYSAGNLRPGTKFYPPTEAGEKKSSIYMLMDHTKSGRTIDEVTKDKSDGGKDSLNYMLMGHTSTGRSEADVTKCKSEGGKSGGKVNNQ